MLSHHQIRESFLNFFKSKGHVVLPSVSVISKNDPSLMFVNAGMNAFKNIFLGTEAPAHPTVCNAQKCIRISGKHNDLDEVGLDSTHHTFFEMLGNWSFGAYYKHEAIAWAWELLTEVWKLSQERLFVTVYREDDEAAQIWSEVSGLPPERIMKFGDKDNFWEMGAVGPCGPCSEIHYDRGDIATREATFSHPIEGVNGENERYVEIWNLVFIQSNRLPDSRLEPLPARHIDTGMGLERIVGILQNKTSNYDTDLFRPLIATLEQISGIAYNEETRIPFRVIVDHIRMLCVCLSDGERPSNEGRGYVMRRVLRRAYRYGRLIHLREPFLHRLADSFIDEMQIVYPELSQKRADIKATLLAEEENFEKTLDRGLSLLNDILNKTEVQKQKSISGGDAFLLYDTYGFPLDLTLLIAAEKGISVDRDTFEREMGRQKLSAAASQKKNQLLSLDPLKIGKKIGLNADGITSGTLYVGEEQEEIQSQLMGIFTLEGDWMPTLKNEGNEVWLVFETTPFYSESGGQVGDTGVVSDSKTQFDITDTQKIGNLILHRGRLSCGELSTRKTYQLEIDDFARSRIRSNHSATHLLHHCLVDVLGSHVKQAGSLVHPEKLRFDFYHHRAMDAGQLKQIEEKVNELIAKKLPSTIRKLPIEEANRLGAKSFFQEKYGDMVRLVEMGPSREFCGGSHVQNTSDIALFKIISEQSAAAGIRRIEAITGTAAQRYWDKFELLVEKIIATPTKALISNKTNASQLLKLKSTLMSLKNLTLKPNPLKSLRSMFDTFNIDVPETHFDSSLSTPAKEYFKKEDALSSFLRILQQKLNKTSDSLQKVIDTILDHQKTEQKLKLDELQTIVPIQKNKLCFYEKKVMNQHVDSIIKYIDSQKNTRDHKIIFITNVVNNEKILFFCGVSPSLISKFRAGELVKIASETCDGNGGGRAEFARGGGKNIAHLETALHLVKKKIGLSANVE